ncbi:MAG: transposase [Rhodospirillaceae bacterium]|nr:transposase [Rhodospirillaceae bacterium]
MPRKLRFAHPGYTQHVIQRGNNRVDIFADAMDRRVYMDMLAKAGAGQTCDIHDYVLMTNHVHLLLTPRMDSVISELMQKLGRRYVRYFLCRHGRTGTLWEGRYRAALIDSDAYLITCMRYIELNPVRVHLVARPGDYAWSSHGRNAEGVYDRFVGPHSLYRALGAVEAERQAAYRELFRQDPGEDDLAEIRSATNGSRLLGDAGFRARIERCLDRAAKPQPRGGDRKSAAYRRASGEKPI